MQTFRDIAEESLFFRRTQITKYTHVYSISLQVAYPTVTGQVVNIEPILQIMEDADFHCTHMTGSVTDPVDVNGTRYVSGLGSDLGLLFPLAGTNYHSRGERGIWFKFEDPEVNRPLQQGIRNRDAVIRAAQYLSPYDNTMMDFCSVFMPGYGMNWGKPVKFDYTLMKNKRLKILIQNRQFMAHPENGVLAYSRVSMAFSGHRYEN